MPQTPTPPPRKFFVDPHMYKLYQKIGSVLSSSTERERECSAFIGNYIYPHLQFGKGSYSKNNVVQNENSIGSACCLRYKG